DISAAHREVLARYNAAVLNKIIGATALGAIIAYALYTISPETVHAHDTTNLVYTVPLVMYGVIRALFLMHRRSTCADTATELAQDPQMLAVGLLWLGTTLWIIS
ncbi:MAG: decaprenyl-phosphate phosphoribosyltransferase, partial [Burkholderiales bacterium]